MATFEEFEEHLRDALTHLYDPTYMPPDAIWVMTNCNPQQGIQAVQTALIRAIEELKPSSNVPPTARIKRLYDLLFNRYIQAQTQEKVAQHLGITPRHLRREQREAVHVLARDLWERNHAEARSVAEVSSEIEIQPSETPIPDDESSEYRAQVRQELASLRKSAPGIVANVAETIRGAAEFGRMLTSERGIGLEAKQGEPNVVAAIHPSMLRQILITAIRELAQHMSSGRITLCTERDEERVRITVSGYPAAADSPPDSDLVREILGMQDGSVTTRMDGDHISFQVELPALNEITVLVVDDNTDLVHFYGRYTAGTRYHIVHAAQGQHVFETIAVSFPDIIVLDVMLPDVDGWELLGQLRECATTRSIPVIVCSVVREKDLALALGAALYLPKPVRRREFIRALDQVLDQAAGRA